MDLAPGLSQQWSRHLHPPPLTEPRIKRCQLLQSAPHMPNRGLSIGLLTPTRRWLKPSEGSISRTEHAGFTRSCSRPRARFGGCGDRIDPLEQLMARAADRGCTQPDLHSVRIPRPRGVAPADPDIRAGK